MLILQSKHTIKKKKLKVESEKIKNNTAQVYSI
jgi:hypothetical protein